MGFEIFCVFKVIGSGRCRSGSRLGFWAGDRRRKQILVRAIAAASTSGPGDAAKRPLRRGRPGLSSRRRFVVLKRMDPMIPGLTSRQKSSGSVRAKVKKLIQLVRVITQLITMRADFTQYE